MDRLTVTNMAKKKKKIVRNMEKEMEKVIKDTEDRVEEIVRAAEVSARLEIPKMAVDYSNEGQNNMARKINEIIDYLNAIPQ